MAKKLSYEDRLRLEIAKEIAASQQSHSNAAIADAFVLAATINTPWQLDFIYDSSPQKALFGERRGGKTTLMGIAGIEKCLRIPNSKVLYIGLTQDSCERAMFNEILARMHRIYNLPAKLVGGDQMRFNNGSIFYLIGLDANTNRKERVRGIKSSLNMIDEMQSYTQDTQLIINEVLGPAAADTKAKTILGGTAGDAVDENYWYQITKDNTKLNPICQSSLHPEWIVYRCEWEKNTAIDELTGNRVCDNVREFLNEQISKHPGIDLTDSWRQEWNAEWITLTSSLIYRFSDFNIQAPPPNFLHNATTILGIDLGYNDPTALTVIAYNLSISNILYVIDTFQQSEMLVPEVAAKIKAMDAIYNFSHMVGDSSSLQVFETMLKTYSLPIKKANRAGKLSHQLVLNGDLQTKSVMVDPKNTELIKQLKTCVWEKSSIKSGKYVEDPKHKNDLSDSFLYAFFFSRHMWYEAPQAKELFVSREQHYKNITSKYIDQNIQNEYFIDFSNPNGDS